MRILAIETTCDETAAAVFTDEPRVLSSIIASQSDLHARFGGVVPEIASRAHLSQVLPVVDEALREAELTLEDLTAVAVAYTPGLIGAILVGLSAAKTLAMVLGLPLIGVNHLEGHIYACQLHHDEDVFPCIGLVVSGGHTNLFYCQGPTDFQLIGSTIDDAAGEAFDKVASILGLGYPGGPVIEKVARAGNPKAYRFPRTFLREDRLDFSFSGLKTAVRYLVQGQNAQDAHRIPGEQEAADVAASFQQAVIDVLIGKSRQALSKHGVKTLCVGGGVAANGALRSALEQMAAEEKITLVVPPLRWCTDNAAMGAVAAERLRRGESDPLDLDAGGGLVRMA
ncbi:tRNA N6-adenosine threonylcarbamoyltransferase [Planctomycetes bacterium Pan216]|uniref:tRNA N6-adenosine threonylcarbamoyltransferase n=1 Tax=Kolteria novifilia TaxID=2527975 RepID=A0A518BD41_9BACT|nr:tRNA N6-adenosine threonylcarbamoyltransferase [Planctomycetes bacterium Pan216]